MSEVNIVIPVFQKPDQLEKCLKAIEDQTFKDIRVIEEDNNTNNRGFTVAVNDGIKKRDEDCKWVVVLNQDCYLKEDAIEKMASFMQEHPNCFIGGIKQLSSENEDFIIHGGCTTAFPAGKHIGGSVSQGHCTENKKVPWVNGACMIVDVSKIEDVGLMDNRFFLLGSDSDWCYTGRSRGFEIWFIADAIAVHEQGISTQSSNVQLMFKMKKDMVYWRDKWIDNGEFRELEMELF